MLTVGAAGAFTVSVALAFVEPPGPLAVISYVVVWVGLTFTLPFAASVPEPTDGLIVTEVAFVEVQVSVAPVPPAVMVDGFTARVTVGAGGGGGVLFALLAPHPARTVMKVRTRTRTRILSRNSDVINPSREWCPEPSPK
jgi:hypothetical protein